MAGRAAVSVGEGAASVAQEGLNRVAGLPEAGLNAFGVLPVKRLRLRVVVLADENNDPVLSPSPRDQVKEAIDVAREIFREQANVNIVAAGRTLITVDTTAAPQEALEVHCSTGALRDDLGKAGTFFRSRMARNAAGNTIGTGAPVTAFVVKKVVGRSGCSLGPLADYVTVQADRVASGSQRLLAHEIGHALGLPHTRKAGKAISGSSSDNLMTPSNHGNSLNRRQVVTIRNSRHVTFL
jgi:hypothetical protein